MKILLGGVPFGCNNVGDEAILECAVRLLKQQRPDAQLTVSTNDPRHTAARLGVDTCELFGFDLPYSRPAMRAALAAHDVFLWCGATGLSDYPEIPLEMLRLAQAAGRKTILWGVGMNSVLNPAKYKLLPGKRRTALACLSALTLGAVDTIALAERRREARVRRKIATYVGDADLVVVRDPESREELQRSGVRREVVVGADSALLLEPAKFDAINLTPEARAWLGGDFRKVGVCISTAAPQFRDLPGLLNCLDRLVADDGTRIAFLPMDPVEDLALMRQLRAQMRQPERAIIVEGRFEPAEVLAIAARLDVAVTSRLHLLILSSVAGVPFVGISCGSKVDSFLHAHGWKAAGTVGNCNFEFLHDETRRLLREREECALRLRRVRQTLLDRLDAATRRLRQVLEAGEPAPAPAVDLDPAAAS